MFTAGAGWLDGRHTKKGKCAKQKLIKAHKKKLIRINQLKLEV
jgi:hypothetical protein